MSVARLAKIQALKFRYLSTRPSLQQSILQKNNLNQHFPSSNLISLVLPKSNSLPFFLHGTTTEFQRNLSSHNAPKSPRKQRSPYAVLGLRKNARRRSSTTITKDEVKAAFRRLAKLYHPDLNPQGLSVEECEDLMSELVEAYEKLLKRISGDNNDDEDDALLENIRVGASNKVALACELYSVDELIMDNFHEVHTLRVDYTSENDNDETKRDLVVEYDDETNGNFARGEDSLENNPGSKNSLPVSPTFLVTTVKAHPGDSIMDLKETIETRFGTLWGLEDDDCLGWEFLFVKKPGSKPKNKQSHGSNPQAVEEDELPLGDTRKEEKDDPTTLASNNVVLSYHLFLEDYQIRHGDTIYAVVRHENKSNL